VKLSESLPRWLELAKRPADDLALAALLMEKAGTGGSLFRNFYRDFLRRPANIFRCPREAHEAHALFAESAREWGAVAAALDTSARTGEAAPLHEARARCRSIADIEVAAMRAAREHLMEIKTIPFLASSPRGFGDLLAASCGASAPPTCANARSAWSSRAARRSRTARVSSRGWPVACSSKWRRSNARERRGVLRRGARHRLAQTHRSVAHHRLRLLRADIPRSRTRSSARCAQGRDLRSAARCTGSRPDVATERPAVRVHAHANGPQVTISIDLAGEGLHRRGYRAQAGEAPLRENLAAGILLRAGWPEKCRKAAEFLDPCAVRARWSSKPP
jgi:hypothetical protein